MQLVIKDGKVRAVYADNVDILGRYDLTEYEIVSWDGPERLLSDEETGELPSDPRTLAQKIAAAKLRYLIRRRHAYPAIRQSLAMIYRDMRDGTTKYVDAINAVNDTFPPPAP